MEDPKHNEGQELDEHVAPPPMAEDDATDDTTPTSKEEEYLAGWKRAQADYANLQKETARLRGEYAKHAAAGVVEKLLPVVDNLSKAMEHAPEDGDAKLKAWTDGIGHIRSQFMAVLKEAGVTAIEETGVPFDPSVHDALMREKREGTDPDVVLAVVEKGYRMHDRVLRPAKVIVSE